MTVKRRINRCCRWMITFTHFTWSSSYISDLFLGCDIPSLKVTEGFSSALSQSIPADETNIFTPHVTEFYGSWEMRLSIVKMVEYRQLSGFDLRFSHWCLRRSWMLTWWGLVEILQHFGRSCCFLLKGKILMMEAVGSPEGLVTTILHGATS